MPEALPDPRPDGVCAGCLANMAVTTDGRFCKKCLKQVIMRLSPGSVARRPRSKDHVQEPVYEPSPWQEHAVRCLEDQ